MVSPPECPSRPPYRCADNAHFADYAAQYWHLEAHTRRKRQMTWSRAVRSAAGLTGERSDETVAGAHEGRVVAELTPMGWERVRDLKLALRSLSTLESGGWEALAVLWTVNGVEFLEAPY
ncbi:hypothetical protein ACFFGH_26875 [Lysobacter korlensis]|uniref:Uncharacterized protein n=1 Tax=Lysobacter korlensis TaxID=553636 RepID=A0ABV6RWV9_9GAMM